MKFYEIRDSAPSAPGIYEIRTHSGLPLKVGIAGDLRKRLRQHAASRDGGLTLKPGGNRSNPSDVLSKQSILAKHLYYDHEIAPGFDLTTQHGRCAFLETECEVTFEVTESREAARELEIVRENSGTYRYRGRVRIRP